MFKSASIFSAAWMVCQSYEIHKLGISFPIYRYQYISFQVLSCGRILLILFLYPSSACRTWSLSTCPRLCLVS